MGKSTENRVLCGLDTLELAVYDAVANYNYGRKATIDIEAFKYYTWCLHHTIMQHFEFTTEV